MNRILRFCLEKFCFNQPICYRYNESCTIPFWNKGYMQSLSF